MSINEQPLISAFFSHQLSGKQLPTNQEVIRELHKILREDPFFNTQNHPISLNIPWLNDFFNSLAKVLHYPLLIILLIAVLFGLYFLIRSITPYIQAKSLPGQPPKKSVNGNKSMPANYYLTLYQQSLEQSQTKQYKKALISLHKATIEYVLTKTIVSASYKKYTNNDLKKKLLSNKTLYQPFCVITRYAEIAGFSNIEINQSDFNRALEIFEKFFL
jgi:hypothetical protein